MAVFMSETPHRVTIEKPSVTQDDHGGNVEAYSTRTANVACLITQQAGSIRPAFHQQHRVQQHTVSMLHTTVSPGDRLLVTTGPANVQDKYLFVRGITNHGGVGEIAAFVRLNCDQEL